MIRVALADDHHLVREGIRSVFSQAADIDVVGEATTGEEAIDLVESTKPDVLVIDVTMPGIGGIEATRQIRESGAATEVVMLSMHADAAVIREAVQVGARGYVQKGSVADELVLAVRAAHRGASYFTSAASQTLLDDKPPGSHGSRAEDALTEREREVLRLIGEGLTNRAIGSHLAISIKTVERHRTSLMAKLDVHSIVELVRAGIKIGVIRLDD